MLCVVHAVSRLRMWFQLAKKAFVYDGTNWIDIAQSTADLSEYQKINRTGLNVVIPTSVAVGSGSATVLVNGQVTFNAVSHIDLSGCFTSTYDNYQIILTDVNTPAGNIVDLRMSSSGTQITDSNYMYHLSGVWGTSTSFTYGSNGSSKIDNIFYANTTNSYASSVIELHNPAKATVTNGFYKSYGYQTDTATRTFRAGGIAHTTLSAYNGFRLISSGTMTGVLRVYGYNNG
jgi:hypothetical protein